VIVFQCKEQNCFGCHQILFSGHKSKSRKLNGRLLPSSVVLVLFTSSVLSFRCLNLRVIADGIFVSSGSGRLGRLPNVLWPPRTSIEKVSSKVIKVQLPQLGGSSASSLTAHDIFTSQELWRPRSAEVSHARQRPRGPVRSPVPWTTLQRCHMGSFGPKYTTQKRSREN